MIRALLVFLLFAFNLTKLFHGLTRTLRFQTDLPAANERVSRD